jgi:hypothetical protein
MDRAGNAHITGNAEYKSTSLFNTLIQERYRYSPSGCVERAS